MKINEIAHIVFVFQEDGNLRCTKSRNGVVVLDGVYTHGFVTALATIVPNVIITGVNA